MPALRRSSRRLARDFEGAISLAAIGPYRLGRLDNIRQRAGTGTKGYITWLVGPDAGQRTAVWLPAVWPKRASVLLVDGEVGGGPHHLEHVFYADHVAASFPRRFGRVVMSTG